MEIFFIWSGVVFWACLFLFIVGLAVGSNTATFDPTIKNGKKEG